MSGKQAKRRRAVQHAANGKGTRPVQAPRVRAPEGRRRQASPRALVAGAAVLIVVALGIGLGVALAGSSSSSLKNVSTVRTLFAGIPQRGNVLGSASAPVTLVEYIDMQCPYCDAFERQVFPDLVRNYVRPGKVRVVIRPLAFIGPDSLRGRSAVLAAGKQNKFFELMQLLYFNQGTENTGWLTQKFVNRAATAVGIDVARLATDQKSASVSRAAKGVDSLAKAQGVHSTPTVLVGKTNGTLRTVVLNSPTDATSVVDAIELTAGS